MMLNQFQILPKLKVLTLLISSSVLLSSCASTTIVETKYIVSTPVKIDRPSVPTFQILDSTKPITDTNNFKKLQINISLLKNYTLGLQDVIDYYEKEIDRLNAQQ